MRARETTPLGYALYQYSNIPWRLGNSTEAALGTIVLHLERWDLCTVETTFLVAECF